jgi:hemerythrin
VDNSFSEEERIMTQSVVQALLEKMSAQHDQLGRTLSDVRENLNRARIDPPAVQRQLKELERQFEAHFRSEEADGYFDEVLARAPHLKHQVDELRGQHAELLSAVASLQVDANRLDAEPGQLAATRVLLDEISKTFLDHETAEGRLLEDAYCRDTSAVD